MVHIVKGHPELMNKEAEILETINSPEIVQKGDAGSLLAIKKFHKTPVTENKYLVVAYKELSESDGFVLTAVSCERVRSAHSHSTYSSDLKRRLKIWKS